MRDYVVSRGQTAIVFQFRYVQTCSTTKLRNTGTILTREQFTIDCEFDFQRTRLKSVDPWFYG